MCPWLPCQASMICTRATTATKLSQKLLVSLANIFDLKIETWDVSGAFLKGFPFPKVREHLRQKGHVTVKRDVSIRPPDNVWRHLRENKHCKMWIPDEHSTWWYVLDCLKSMYGLNDAPLAWQLVLQDYLLGKRKGIQSQFDECFVWWMKGPGEVLSLLTCHVDDNAVASEQWWLDKEFKLFFPEHLSYIRNKFSSQTSRV